MCIGWLNMLPTCRVEIPSGCRENPNIKFLLHPMKYNMCVVPSLYSVSKTGLFGWLLSCWFSPPCFRGCIYVAFSMPVMCLVHRFLSSKQIIINISLHKLNAPLKYYYYNYYDNVTVFTLYVIALRFIEPRPLYSGQRESVPRCTLKMCFFLIFCTVHAPVCFCSSLAFVK